MFQRLCFIQLQAVFGILFLSTLGFASNVREVTLRLRPNYPERVWLEASADHARVLLISPNQSDPNARRSLDCLDPDLYEQKVQGLEQQADLFSKWVVEFAAWTQLQGVNYVSDFVRSKPITLFEVPLCKATYGINTFFAYHQFDSPLSDWWILNQFALPDLDQRSKQKALMAHEMGHFVFQSLVWEQTGQMFYEITDARSAYLRESLPLNEAFADFLSFAFTQEAVVGRKFDYEQEKTVEIRTALSTSIEDRIAVRTGQWNPKGEPHKAGEPLRDVLIEDAQMWGVESTLKKIRRIIQDTYRKQRTLKEAIGAEF
jgi:hypothetical protein